MGRILQWPGILLGIGALFSALAAGAGWVRLPQTGQGVPSSSVWASRPACASRNARSSPSRAVCASVWRAAACRYCSCAALAAAARR